MTPRIAERTEDIHAIRVAAGGADLVLGGDIVVAGNKKVLGAVKSGATTLVINLAEFLPGDFTRNAEFSLPTERLKRALRRIAAASLAGVAETAKTSHRHGVPFTSATPLNFQIMPRLRSLVTCRRSSSPGTTGLRKRQSSMLMK